MNKKRLGTNVNLLSVTHTVLLNEWLSVLPEEGKSHTHYKDAPKRRFLKYSYNQTSDLPHFTVMFITVKSLIVCQCMMWNCYLFVYNNFMILYLLRKILPRVTSELNQAKINNVFVMLTIF